MATSGKKLNEIDQFINFKNYKGLELHDIAALAANLLNSPLSLITIAGVNAEYYFHNKLDSVIEKEALQSFCLNLSPQNPLVIVHDTLKDRTAIKNRHVHGRPYIRFFTAVMLKTYDGQELGCLSVADDKPKVLTEVQIYLLKILVKRIVHIIHFESGTGVLKNQFTQMRKQAINELDTEIHKIIS